MSENVKTIVYKILGRDEDAITTLKIDAFLEQILHYLNRDEVDNEILNSVALVIADEIKRQDMGTKDVQSIREGDLSVTYSIETSPFLGRLDSFKRIRGLN